MKALTILKNRDRYRGIIYTQQGDWMVPESFSKIVNGEDGLAALKRDMARQLSRWGREHQHAELDQIGVVPVSWIKIRADPAPRRLADMERDDERSALKAYRKSAKLLVQYHKKYKRSLKLGPMDIYEKRNYDEHRQVVLKLMTNMWEAISEHSRKSLKSPATYEEETRL